MILMMTVGGGGFDVNIDSDGESYVRIISIAPLTFSEWFLQCARGLETR